MTPQPTRLRLRRRLLVASAPATVLALLVVVKLISVVLAGNSAISAFRDGDADAVRDDATVLGMLNVVQPANAPFAAGTAAVLDGRLEDADRDFTAALALTEAAASCPTLVNLELVRETQGDRAAATGDLQRADERYASALDIVEQAPRGCFAGNADTDPQRQAVRDDAANRLAIKRSGLTSAPPVLPPASPPPPPPPAVAPPPLPPAVTPDGEEIPPRPLDPAGDPLDVLQRILQDAAGVSG